MVNSVLQWTGTCALLTMYVLMSFYQELFPWNLVAGLIGGTMYFIWSWRTKNRAQILVNLAGMSVCTAGLIKYFA